MIFATPISYHAIGRLLGDRKYGYDWNLMSWWVMNNEYYFNMNKFISRNKNFHFSKEYHTETSDVLNDIFTKSFLLCEELKSEFGSEEEIIKCDNRVLLRKIFTATSDFVSLNIDEIDVFSTFTEHCPKYLEEFGESIGKLMEANGLSIDETAECLDAHISDTVINACIFTSLLYYIDHSIRVKSITLRELIYNHAPLKFSIPGSAHYLKTPKYSNQEILTKTATIIDSYHELEKATDSLKHYRNRVGPNNSKHLEWKKWYEIPIHNEPIESIMHLLVYGIKAPYETSISRLNKLYKTIHREYKSPRDDHYKYRMNSACGKALCEIQKVKYKNYIKQSKLFLNKLSENKQFYGINLYKFEMAYKLYRITTTVNELIESESSDDFERVLNCSYYLDNIIFPGLYDAFEYLDTFEEMSNCVASFKMLQLQFIYLSKLIIDEFVEEGYFGNDDEWYKFFVDVLNEQSKKLLYNPSEIDYSIESKSQEYFEAIISKPINMHRINEELSMVDLRNITGRKNLQSDSDNILSDFANIDEI